jgi:hypothetical protein
MSTAGVVGALARAPGPKGAPLVGALVETRRQRPGVVPLGLLQYGL